MGACAGCAMTPWSSPWWPAAGTPSAACASPSTSTAARVLPPAPPAGARSPLTSPLPPPYASSFPSSDTVVQRILRGMVETERVLEALPCHGAACGNGTAAPRPV